MENSYEKAQEAASCLRAAAAPFLSTHAPTIGIICGSGLGGLAQSLDASSPPLEVGYADIPHFPRATVLGHTGKLAFGLLGASKTPVVLMVGRAHYYEGHSIQKVTLPVRTLRLLGVKTLLVTNAAGGLNPDYAVGDVVILNDHLNLAGLAGVHPLRGPNDEELGVRFPALSDAYDLDLRRTAHHAWNKTLKHCKRNIHEGVYAFVGGPSYETRAECRMLRTLGADVVGMSTVPEIIVARHCGLRILAMSLVTNKAVLDPGPKGNDVRVEDVDGNALNRVMEIGKATHEEVIAAGAEAARDVQKLVEQIAADLV